MILPVILSLPDSFVVKPLSCFQFRRWRKWALSSPFRSSLNALVLNGNADEHAGVDAGCFGTFAFGDPSPFGFVLPPSCR